MNLRTLLLCVAVAVLAGGCASNKEMYYWGGYENALYKYYKDADKLEQYTKTLGRAIASGERSNRVAPGLYAEYGYALLTMGDATQALHYFELEKKTWPESTHLMNVMIKSANSATSSSTTSEGGSQ